MCDSWDFFDDGLLWGVGWDSTWWGGVRRPGWVFVGPCLALGFQEVMVPRWVSTPPFLTLKTLLPWE